jgi:arabinogalactan oligomer/maltooligosaccharide transport system permease protein
MHKNRNTSAVLSVLCMGLGQIYNRQFIKGILFIAFNMVGIIYFVNHLPKAIWGIVTLGENGARMEKVGKLTQVVPGDHSIFLMISSIVTILAFIVFMCSYYLNVKDAIYNGNLMDIGERTPSFLKSLANTADKKFPHLMLTLPAITITFLTIMPIIFTVMLAFTNYSAPNHIPPKSLVDWVGFDNFVGLLEMKTWSRTFFGVLKWTVIWAVSATVTTYFGGLIVAVLIQQKGIKFKGLWRTIFIIPYAIPQLISLLLMRNLFNGQWGPINQYLGYFGLGKLPWLTDPTWAKLTVIIVNSWVGIPVSMILIMGILTTIPRELYEAAEVDGATPFQQFWHITIPRVLFSTAPILITQFAGNINNFNVIFLLTNGNPVTGDYQFAGHTDLLVTWLYKLTLDQSQFNMAAVIGIIIFIIIASISIFSYTRTKSFKEEDMMQ